MNTDIEVIDSKIEDKQTTIEVFLHGCGRPSVLTAQLVETLEEVLTRAGALPGEGEFVFVGECEDAGRNPNEEIDSHEPADLSQTLEQLGLRKHKHIHSHAVHRVEVGVFFNGVEKKRHFSPAATIATTTAWAKHRFSIDPTAGADIILSLRPNGNSPRPDEHLGELLSDGSHTLVFDLVREVTPQG